MFTKNVPARAVRRAETVHKIRARGRSIKTLRADREKVEQQIEQFLGRIAGTTTPSVIAAYEKRILDLEEQKIVLTEKSKRAGKLGRGLMKRLEATRANTKTVPTKKISIDKITMTSWYCCWISKHPTVNKLAFYILLFGVWESAHCAYQARMDCRRAPANAETLSKAEGRLM
jgi:hypothetical protein